MRFIAPITIFCFILFQQVAYSCEIINFIAPERLCLDRVGNYRGNGIKASGCGQATIQSIEVISGPGNHTLNYTTTENNEASISFDQVGVYTIRYTFLDEDGCGTAPCVEEQTTEVFYPEAEFVEESISICKGESVEAQVSFFNASTASVQGQGQISVSNDGSGMGTYRTVIPVNQTFTLKIVAAQEGSCSNETVLDSLIVNVLDEPQLIAIDTICDDKNEMYTAVFEITGGDGEYTLVSTEIGTITDNILTTIPIPTLESFDYTINSGPTCGVFSGSASAECVCTTAPGSMQIEPIEACQDETITVEHNMNTLDKRPSDSIIYVLHNNNQAEIGTFYALSYEPEFALPNEDLVDSQLYVSVVVGPFSLENFDIAPVECKGVSAGTPVRWYANDTFDISGVLEVCAGEKNRMYKVNISDEIKNNREDLFWSTTAGSGFVIESQNRDRAYLSFPTATSSGQLFFQVDRKISNVKTCSSIDSVEIKIDGNESAPEQGEIILWPGDIFASTSDGPCYQWGFVDRFDNFSVQLIGDNDKYFFSNEPVRGRLNERAYFCAIFDNPECEFSFNNCNSITFFNQNTLGGLAEGAIDDFEIILAPNPSDGRMRLDLTGSYRGRYNVQLFSELGQLVKAQNIEKQYARSITDLDFSDVSRGVYFLRVQNENGTSQILKIVITR